MRIEKTRGRAVLLALLLTGPLHARSMVGADASVDLVVYGDTRGGALQNLFGGGVRARAIHAAVATRIGALSDLARSRALLFVGDAVSVGGCGRLWKSHFLRVLPNLCPAFCNPGSAESKYNFFPVVGDHETWDLPRVPEDESRPCGGSEATLQSQVEMDSVAGDATTLEHMRPGEDCSEWRHPDRCAEFRRMLKTDRTNDALRGSVYKCDRCEYQENVAYGNINSYSFNRMFTAARGFSAFQSRRAAKGATWYYLDFSVGPPSRVFRVFMLDTQTDPDLAVDVGGRRESQLEWIRATIDTMPSGSVMILVGHQTPSTTDSPGRIPQTLYEEAITRAARRGIRTAAILAGHHHTYGQGEFELSVPGCSAQRTLGVLSGDGGARDAGLVDRSESGRMISAKGIGGIKATSLKWQKGHGSVAMASFGRLTLSADSVELSPYQVVLEPGNLVKADLDEVKLMEGLAKRLKPQERGVVATRVYDSVKGTAAGPSAVDPLTHLTVDLRAPVSCASGLP